MVQLLMDNFLQCSESDCENPARTKGMCPKHYARGRRGGGEAGPNLEPYPICRVSHCDRVAHVRTEGALCQAHYQLEYRGKDPEMCKLRENPTGNRIFDSMCAVPGCPRRASSKGCCKPHYERIAEGKLEAPAGTNVPLRPMCTFEGCRNRQRNLKHGLCHAHHCQMLDGRELAPLREHGAYVDGSNRCVIGTCKKPAVSARLCNSHLTAKKKYALTVAELEAVLAPGVCQNPGCNNTKRLHIDHDHGTGKVRGLLCSGCNTALGHLGEDIERMLGLAEYKRLHS